MLHLLHSDTRAYFAPILLAVLLQQVYDRFKDYKKEFAVNAVEKIETGADEEKKKSVLANP